MNTHSKISMLLAACGLFLTPYLSPQAYAQSVIEQDSLISVGEIGYGGSGCLNDTLKVETTLGEEEGLFALNFQNYHSLSHSEKALDRQSCALSIPIKLAAGYKLSVVDMTYNGYALLTHNSTAILSSEVFLAGTRGEVLTQEFTYDEDKEYGTFFSRSFQSQTDQYLATTSCGASTTLRINTSLKTKTEREEDSFAFLSLTSFYQDMNSQLHFIIEKCF